MNALSYMDHGARRRGYALASDRAARVQSFAGIRPGEGAAPTREQLFILLHRNDHRRIGRAPRDNLRPVGTGAPEYLAEPGFGGLQLSEGPG